MRKFIGFVVFGLALFGTTSVSAEPPNKEHVRQLLMGYETVPTAQAWRAMGPDTIAVLVDLYNDAVQPGFVRLRAVGAVGSYDTPAARTFLLAVAHTSHQSDLFIREAVLAMQRAFGARAVADIEPFLANEFPVVREASVRALAKINTPRARRLLRQRQRVEADATVQTALSRALAH